MTWNQVVSYFSEPSGLFRIAELLEFWIICAIEQCLLRFNVHICHLGSCENTDSTGLRWALRFYILTNPSDVSAMDHTLSSKSRRTLEDQDMIQYIAMCWFNEPPKLDTQGLLFHSSPTPTLHFATKLTPQCILSRPQDFSFCKWVLTLFSHCILIFPG